MSRREAYLLACRDYAIRPLNLSAPGSRFRSMHVSRQTSSGWRSGIELPQSADRCTKHNDTMSMELHCCGERDCECQWKWRLISLSRRAFCACSRFSAWSKTIDWGPSMTSAVCSSPRMAGRQFINLAVGLACRIKSAET